MSHWVAAHLFFFFVVIEGLLTQSSVLSSISLRHLVRVRIFFFFSRMLSLLKTKLRSHVLQWADNCVPLMCLSLPLRLL